MDVGLMQDSSLPQPPALASSDPSLVPHAFGLVAMESLDSIQAREDARDRATEANNRPVIQGLAGHVRECWTAAFNAKRTTDVEQRMLKAMRQRRGQYDPEILAEIRKTGGSEVYMMLTSNKCRAASSWLKDILLGTSNEKPWTISPTPLPELPPAIEQAVMQLAQQEVAQHEQALGQPVGPQDQEKILGYVRDRVVMNAKKRAKETCERLELKMEDQLTEGGFLAAMTDFIEDITTFPSAFLVGPVVRKKKKLSWVPSQGGFEASVEEKIVLEWERADPFMIYPMPHVTNVEDGGVFRRHRLTTGQLNELVGVDGYNDDAIRTVLDEYGKGGLHDWLVIDSQKAQAEGKAPALLMANPEATIDALQYLGSVQGKLLAEWDPALAPEIKEPTKDYACEVWLIGQWVIKAVLNADPLGRKNIYKASYEEVPGSFWGNAVTDLCRDAQAQCNTAARAMANNMGIASGPQAVYNVDRLPPGEDITQMYPWKIWQANSDPYGSSSKPVEFFSPSMISGELMQIYTFFSGIADEHTGLPRYMAGDATGSGALRTSSGISMLMGNASKGIKQVVSNIDVNVTKPLIERLHFYNMMYGDDPSLKTGDIEIVARGAASLVVKETRQQRINEFLQLALSNPLVNQIVGEEAIASLLRVAARELDMDTDEIVPPPEIIRARVFQQTQQQQITNKEMQNFQLAMATKPSQEFEIDKGPNGEILGIKVIDKRAYPWEGGASLAVPMGGLGAQEGAQQVKIMSPSNQDIGGAPSADFMSPAGRA